MTGPRLGTQGVSKTLQDLSSRVDQLERHGPRFSDPVSLFTVTPGPAQIGARVKFRIAFTAGIDSIHIHRNNTRDFGTAKIIQTLTTASITAGSVGEQSNTDIIYLDSDASLAGNTAFYWLHIHPMKPGLTPIVHGPLSIVIPQFGDSSLLPQNSTVNATNFATVDSVDSGGGTATARIYGVGGVGSAWTRKDGTGRQFSYPPGSIVGLVFTTKYTVYWDATLRFYRAFTSFVPALADTLVWVGAFTTVNPGGGGGVTGGGGSGGSSSGAPAFTVTAP